MLLVISKIESWLILDLALILNVIQLVSRSGGETDGVVTYVIEPNQCTNDFKPIFSFDELYLLSKSKRFIELLQMCILQDKITFENLKSLSIF